MARTGRPPKPVEQMRAAGNPGKRPLPEPVAVVAALAARPEPPAHLGEVGQLAWAHIVTEAQAWLAPSDLLHVSLICQALDERARLVATVQREGVTFLTEKGYLGVHPALSELRKLDAQLTTWLGLAGLTAADRSKLGFAEVRRASKLADLRSRLAAPPSDPGRPG